MGCMYLWLGIQVARNDINCNKCNIAKGLITVTVTTTSDMFIPRKIRLLKGNTAMKRTSTKQITFNSYEAISRHNPTYLNKSNKDKSLMTAIMTGTSEILTIRT